MNTKTKHNESAGERLILEEQGSNLVFGKAINQTKLKAVSGVNQALDLDIESTNQMLDTFSELDEKEDFEEIIRIGNILSKVYAELDNSYNQTRKFISGKINGALFNREDRRIGEARKYFEKLKLTLQSLPKNDYKSIIECIIEIQLFLKDYGYFFYNGNYINDIYGRDRDYNSILDKNIRAASENDLEGLINNFNLLSWENDYERKMAIWKVISKIILNLKGKKTIYDYSVSGRFIRQSERISKKVSSMRMKKPESNLQIDIYRLEKSLKFVGKFHWPYDAMAKILLELKDKMEKFITTLDDNNIILSWKTRLFEVNMLYREYSKSAELLTDLKGFEIRGKHIMGNYDYYNGSRHIEGLLYFLQKNRSYFINIPGFDYQQKQKKWQKKLAKCEELKDLDMQISELEGEFYDGYDYLDLDDHISLGEQFLELLEKIGNKAYYDRVKEEVNELKRIKKSESENNSYKSGNRLSTAMGFNEALEVFGVSGQTIIKEELRKKYKSLVRENHPDKGGDEEKMKDINNAYEVLKQKV